MGATARSSFHVTSVARKGPRRLKGALQTTLWAFRAIKQSRRGREGGRRGEGNTLRLRWAFIENKAQGWSWKAGCCPPRERQDHQPASKGWRGKRCEHTNVAAQPAIFKKHRKYSTFFSALQRETPPRRTSGTSEKKTTWRRWFYDVEEREECLMETTRDFIHGAHLRFLKKHWRTMHTLKKKHFLKDLWPKHRWTKVKLHLSFYPR